MLTGSIKQFVPGSTSEVLITSADSRIRVVNSTELVHKLKGTFPASPIPSFSFEKRITEAANEFFTRKITSMHWYKVSTTNH